MGSSGQSDPAAVDIAVPATDRAGALADLWVALAGGQRDYGSHVEPTANRTRIRESIVRHIVNSELLAASDAGTDGGTGTGADTDGDLVGFVMFGTEEGTFAVDQARGFVENLYVRPDRREEGIGSALLAAAERRLSERGVDAVALEVMADNRSARRFYRRAGYEPHRVELEKPVGSDTHSNPGE